MGLNIWEQVICANCGRKWSKRELAGSGTGCIIAVILFISVIGVVFLPFVWGKKKCPKCGSTNIVPLDTPRGRKLLEEYSENKITSETLNWRK
jgi:predicted nucleic-acid-binding Zn-ribbon protein